MQNSNDKQVRVRWQHCAILQLNNHCHEHDFVHIVWSVSAARACCRYTADVAFENMGTRTATERTKY